MCPAAATFPTAQSPLPINSNLETASWVGPSRLPRSRAAVVRAAQATMSGPLSPAAPGTKRHRADGIKAEGNRLYGKGDFRGAAACYSRAIEVCPSVAIYYSNRGLCHKQLKDWAEANADACRALEYDDSNVKAHMLRGESLCHMHQWDRGIRSLNKALRLAEKHGSSGRLIEGLRAILERNLATKHRQDELVIATEDAELLSYLQGALDASVKEKVAAARRDCTGAEVGGKVAEIESRHSVMQDRLQLVFSERDTSRDETKREVPDWLCGQISLELLRDPVCTPAGHTYERRCILAHLQRSATDPVTRKPLTARQLVPNLAVRHAATEFLKANPWASPHHDEDF